MADDEMEDYSDCCRFCGKLMEEGERKVKKEKVSDLVKKIFDVTYAHDAGWMSITVNKSWSTPSRRREEFPLICLSSLLQLQEAEGVDRGLNTPLLHVQSHPLRGKISWTVHLVTLQTEGLNLLRM